MVIPIGSRSPKIAKNLTIPNQMIADHQYPRAYIF